MADFRPDCRNFCINKIRTHNPKSKKLPIFRFSCFFDLIDFRYRFQVQNTSTGPPGLISGRISSFRPLPADLSIFDVLVKISFFVKIGQIGRFSEANYLAGSGRKVVKSPEMCSPDLVDAFCTRNRYLKSFRSKKLPFGRKIFLTFSY